MKTNEVHSINLDGIRSSSLKHKINQKIQDMFPHVNVHTVDDYFALPKSKREKWGIYLLPSGLPANFWQNENVKGWDEFNEEIRKHYPIQGWVREWLFSMDNPIYSLFTMIGHRFDNIKYAVKHFIRPAHPRFRKAYPRHKWNDISHAFVSVSFAMIQDFYHEEISMDIVNWDSTPGHKEFREWLENAIHWIEKGRSQVEKDLDEEYKRIDHKNRDLTYEEKYAKIHELEKRIEDTDSKILKEMVEYRGYFWT